MPQTLKKRRRTPGAIQCPQLRCEPQSRSSIPGVPWNLIVISLVTSGSDNGTVTSTLKKVNTEKCFIRWPSHKEAPSPRKVVVHESSSPCKWMPLYNEGLNNDNAVSFYIRCVSSYHMIQHTTLLSTRREGNGRNTKIAAINGRTVWIWKRNLAKKLYLER